MDRRENLLNHVRKSSPFLLILLPWITGILCADYFALTGLYGAFNSNVLLTISIAALGVLGMFLFLSVNSIFPLLTISALSFVWSASRLPHESLNLNSEFVAFAGRVEGIEKGRIYSRIVLEGMAIHKENEGRAFDGKVLLFLPDSLSQLFDESDLLHVRGRLQHINPPVWPGEFNWRKFYERKGIRWNLWVKDVDDISIVEKGRRSLIGNLHFRLVNGIEKSMLSSDAKPLVKALILGDKTELTDELRHNFTASGVSHVLAVSGLHVGMLYLLVTFLLNRVRILSRLPFLEAVITTLIIWTYAGLTDFSSSVVRSAFMFSLIGLASTLRRRSAIYNSIFASAFFILIFFPERLFDVGFQLSYSAVLAIVALHPILRAIIHSGQLWWDKVLNLSCVSIAAQLGTLPITLNIFGIFPVYFILANLFVIPLVTALLTASLVFCVTISAGFEFLGNYLSYLINAIVFILHWSTDFIGKSDYAVLDISINGLQSFTLATALLLLCYSVYFRKRLTFLMGLCILMILPILDWSRMHSARTYILRDGNNLVLGNINGSSHSVAIIKGVHSLKIEKTLMLISEHFSTDPPEISIPNDAPFKNVKTKEGFSLYFSEESRQLGINHLDTNDYVLNTSIELRPLRGGIGMKERRIKLRYRDYVEWVN